MRGRLLDCFPSEFVTVKNQQCILLPGVPPEIVKEFNDYIESMKQMRQRCKEEFGTDDFEF